MLAQDHITFVSGTTQTLALFILALVAGSLVSLICVHFLDREVSPISDAVSDYGARGHAWFYRLVAIWLGLAGLLTAVMFSGAVVPKPTLTILALLVFAATRWAITIFPVDLEGEQETSVGRSHTMLAVIAFSSIAIAAVSFSLTVADQPGRDSGDALMAALAAFVTVSAVATGAAWAADSRFFGLIERVLYLAMFAWFSALALLILSI